MSAWTRIFLRYLAAFLVAKGLIPSDVADTVSGDPEIAVAVEALIGMALGAAVEGWYVLSKRMGWQT